MIFYYILKHIINLKLTSKYKLCFIFKKDNISIIMNNLINFF